MNRDGDTSVHCPPRRLFVNQPSHDIEQHMSTDHERDDDNQDGSELYLAEDDGGDFNELAAETSSLASSESSGFVCSEQGTITAIRVRPMLPSEKKSGYRIIVDLTVKNDGIVTRIVNPTALPPSSRGRSSPLSLMGSSTESTGYPPQFTQEFWFDYSYWTCDRSRAHQVSPQSSIFDELGVLALETLLQGHNCSVFAYGQPGAGKTYTMMGSSDARASLPASASVNGSDSDSSATSALTTSDRRGVIPRICQSLFAEVDERKRAGNSCTVLMSYVEIYDERVYDLLSQTTIKKSLKVREHPEDGAFVERAQRVHVTSYTQVLGLIQEGNRTRSVACTHNNDRRMRSHTVLIISLTQHVSAEPPRKSKLCLVDLAGSERVDHSGASGVRRREVASINRSLATLADVVGALAKRRVHRSADGSQHHKTFVPYRNSVLTRLLKECLGGRAKTIMIGTISPCCAHYEESIATLRYIERARSVYSTGRLQVDTAGDTAMKCLSVTNELKSNICAANKAFSPSAMSNACYGARECYDSCLGCEVCSQRSSDDYFEDELLLQASLEANVQEITTLEKNTDLERNATNREQATSLHVEIPANRTKQKQPEGPVSRKCVHLLNLVAIRRRWQTLRQYRAWNRWRKLNSLEKLQVKLEENNDNEEDMQIENHVVPQKSIGRRAGCPPLHTRVLTTGAQSVGRTQDVVAAVVVTDAICCSVVQDFMFPFRDEPTKLSMQQPSVTPSASLLELLASSSEFDRSQFCFDLSEDCSKDVLQLEKLALPEEWLSIEENELSLPELDVVDSSDKLDTTEREKSSIHSTLSLCVDSIDMARRALGPGVRNLRCQSTANNMIASGTGVECELLRYLDKRFIAMTQVLEDVIIASKFHDANPLRSTFHILETMISDFCLQTIVKLCDQLPSASSSCVAGRQQLVTQLEQFSDQVKRQFLPEITRGNGSETNKDYVHAAFFVATELLVMTERIKLVWSFAGQKKRERLLQAQALEAAAIKDRKLAVQIAALGERNAELSAKYALLVATKSRLGEAEHELTYGKYAKSRRGTSALLSTECVSEMNSASRVAMMEARAVELQRDLEDARKHAQGLESQLMESTHFNLEQNSELENVKANLSWIKNAEMGRNLRKAQTQQEATAMFAEDLVAQLAALTDHVSIQADHVSELETRIEQGQIRVLELEVSLTAAVQERDEHIVVLCQTEEALDNAFAREKVLHKQLAGSSARESEEMIHVRGELHGATLELGSLRGELAELLNYSTLQSATIETLTLEQAKTLQRTQELETERDELLRRCQVEKDISEHKERAYQAQIQKTQEQAKRTVLKQEEIICSLTEQLQECRTELNASTNQWIRAETQCGLLQVSIDQLHCSLTEAKEAGLMQFADVESSQLRDNHLYDFDQATAGAVNEHLTSLDAWFSEVISGNQENTETLCPHQDSGMIETQGEKNCDKARDENFAARSSLLKTLTDLNALTNGLLVVCESSSDAETRANNSTGGESDYGLNPHEASGDTNDSEECEPDETIQESSGSKGTNRDKVKVSSEVCQLRKIVVKLKDALIAKDDMLLFLDGKVRRLEECILK